MLPRGLLHTPLLTSCLEVGTVRSLTRSPLDTTVVRNTVGFTSFITPGDATERSSEIPLGEIELVPFFGETGRVATCWDESPPL